MALCTYQGEAWLPELLESLAAQELLPDELVVQDDASTDGTVALLEAFAASAPFPVRLVVNPERVGSTPNFERALARVEGRYVALADQDDIWYPHKLARLVGMLEDDPILTLAFSDADLVDERGRPTGRRLWSGRGIRHHLVAHEIVPCALFARRSLSTGCTMVARRRAVEAALPFPTSLDDPQAPMRHDRWLSLVAAAVGTVRAVPEPLLAFRSHPEQQTGVLEPAQLRSRLAAAAVAALAGDDPARAVEHEVRAQQVAEAAHRADLWGDFEEADELRRVARHHEVRADLGDTIPERTRRVWGQVADGGYDRSAMGVASAAADLARALRPARRTAP
ncbi:MAG: glycosyltransferase family 2 protein [Acidimicrobiales bacterium]|nr:glycosyltransferase family 2 protein [Actinomycetota bacterium]